MDKTWLLSLPSKDFVIEVIEWIPNVTFFLLKLSCFLFPHFLKFSFSPQMSCFKRNSGWNKSKLNEKVCTANCKSALLCCFFRAKRLCSCFVDRPRRITLRKDAASSLSGSVAISGDNPRHRSWERLWQCLVLWHCWPSSSWYPRRPSSGRHPLPPAASRWAKASLCLLVGKGEERQKDRVKFCRWRWDQQSYTPTKTRHILWLFIKTSIFHLSSFLLCPTYSKVNKGKFIFCSSPIFLGKKPAKSTVE